MSAAKIDLSYGSVSFSAEGDEQWIAAQLDKVLGAAPKLTQLASREVKGGPASRQPGDDSDSSQSTGSQPEGTLAAHIRTKKAESQQNLRFLATADWLRLRGEAKLKTAAVSKALSDAHQKRLNNPADCLNQNVRKGFCEKRDDGFFNYT
jgi:hypothetical protein